ncbi:alpha/beta fold hydrolase [Novispirillum itersonii]|uniref:alpha/beta fold hydrolase n=1 Tax=Novispirillum itersonii TaxID=189 RepID=UPI0003620E72|nr:alpha/beta fold hydrolase [Novispirillum itersonii]
MTGQAIHILWDGPADAATVLVLAHGAGAPMDSPFQAAVAAGLAGRGLRVARFEFPYMARLRAGEGRRPPDREPVLLDCWRAVLGQVRQAHPGVPLVIAGKSMGGRMATLLAADRPGDVRAVVALGYPFHPAGKPEAAAKRLQALYANPLPMLIVQGERDALGDRGFVSAQDLPPHIRLHWLPDGDHSFKPRRSAGVTEAENLQAAVAAVTAFLTAL